MRGSERIALVAWVGAGALMAAAPALAQDWRVLMKNGLMAQNKTGSWVLDHQSAIVGRFEHLQGTWLVGKFKKFSRDGADQGPWQFAVAAESCQPGHGKFIARDWGERAVPDPVQWSREGTSLYDLAGNALCEIFEGMRNKPAIVPTEGAVAVAAVTPDPAPAAAGGTAAAGAVLPWSRGLEGLRVGMKARELPPGFRRQLIDPASERAQIQMAAMLKQRAVACYERDLPRAAALEPEKLVLCFDADRDALVRVTAHLPRDTFSSPAVMDVKRRVDAVAGTPGVPEADNGHYGYTKFFWRRGAGAGQTHVSFWSVPAGTFVAEESGALYDSGRLPAPPPGRP